MGLSSSLLKFIDTSIEDVFGTETNLRMLELGDQCTNDIAIPEKTGKAYFENIEDSNMFPLILMGFMAQ